MTPKILITDDEVHVEHVIDDLHAIAEVVSVHCVLTPETENLIGAQELGKMKQTSFLIDVSRGAIIDENALIISLKKKADCRCRPRRLHPRTSESSPPIT